jgi:hypothetical protein
MSIKIIPNPHSFIVGLWLSCPKCLISNGRFLSHAILWSVFAFLLRRALAFDVKKKKNTEDRTQQVAE